MFESKFFTAMIVISFLLLAAGLVFQYLEMDEYKLIAELMNK